jgi:dynein heavy chain
MEGKTVTQTKKTGLTDKEKTEFVGHFLVSLVWGVGSFVENRKAFNDFLNQEVKLMVEKETMMKGLGKEILMPSDSTFYEIFFDFEKKNWNLWNNKPEFRIPRDTAFHDIYIPTTDS